jgi:hypothetical protein
MAGDKAHGMERSRSGSCNFDRGNFHSALIRLRRHVFPVASDRYGYDQRLFGMDITLVMHNNLEMKDLAR